MSNFRKEGKETGARMKCRAVTTLKFLCPRIALAILFAAISTVAPAAAGVSPGKAQAAVDSFAAASRLPAESMAVIISELPSGKVLGKYNSELPLVPASIMKSVTLSSVSDVLDVDDRIITEVSVGGKPDSDGLLHGNLYIKGAGDPSVNSRVWPESRDILEEIADALRKAGIRSIEGKVIIDDSYLAGPSVPDSWSAGDLRASYGTGSHSFNYSNNASGKSSVSNPAAVFGSELRRRLSACGISLGNEEVKDSGQRRVILKHESPEIKELLRSCMMRSDNLYAETFLRIFGKSQGGDGSTADAVDAESKMLKKKGYDMKGVRIIDGSGLSRANRVTARFMENVLRGRYEDVEYVSYFPLAGQEGTLRRFLADTPLDSYIALKTGSMRGIQCYAGYKLDDDFAPTHAVVVIVNDFKCDRSYLRSQVEKMLLSVFSPSLK